VLSFAKKLGVAALGQAATLFFGAVCGFLVIHTMSKETYAQYSFLQSWLAFFSALSVTTLLGTYNAIAGPSASNQPKLLSVTATTWRLNLPFIGIAAALAIPALIFPTWGKGWYSPDFLVAVALGVGLVLVTVVNRFHQSVLQIEGRVKTISSLLPAVEGGRTGTFLVCMALGFGGYACPFVAAALLCQIASNVYCAKLPSGQWLRTQPEPDVSKETTHRFWEVQKPLLFPSYFYQVQSFFMPAIIAWLAPTDTIADVGALGRLMMLLMVLDRSLDIVFYPSLAREEQFARFEKKLLIGVAGFALLSVGLVASAAFVPDLWLWLLGAKYASLNGSLMWAVLATCIERIGGMFIWAMVSKGMAKHLSYSTLAGFLAQIVFVLNFVPNTVFLAVMFNLTRILIVTVSQIGSYLWLRRSQAARGDFA